MVKSLLTSRTESTNQPIRQTEQQAYDVDIMLGRLGIAAYVIIIGWIFGITLAGIYYATH